MSDTKYTGGPAFPPTFPGRTDGMTLRDWFATHAPTEVPEWFTHQGQPLPAPLSRWQAIEQAPGFNRLTADEKVRLHEWARDPIYDLEEPMHTIGEAAFAAIASADATLVRLKIENEAARYYAWRWAYADAMLEGRLS